MESRKFYSILALMLIGLVSSCTDSNDDNTGPGKTDQQGDASDLTKYEQKAVFVNRGGTDDGTVQLRFYEDLPNVPYISIADFQALVLPGTTVSVEQTVAGEYTLKGPYATATVSTVAETFTSDDYMGFTNLMSLVQRDNMANVYLDGAPYIRYSKMELTPATATVTFDFKKYDIDLRGDGKNVFFPLCTLSALYSDLYYHLVSYNGDKVVVVIDNNESSVSKLDRVNAEKIISAEKRPADVAVFGYKQLCFNIDYFYGMPGRSTLENGIKTKGLDKTLEELPDGKLIKQLLTSQDMKEYFLGMNYLDTLLDDGGHTGLYVDMYALTAIDEDQGFMKWTALLREEIANHPELKTALNEYFSTRFFNKGAGISVMRNEVLPGTDTYRTAGNTAYCLYDGFGPTNLTAWRDYYNSGCTGPTPAIDEQFTGDLAVVLEALKAAEADATIQNFVMDLTDNHGGSLDVVLAMTQLMAGQSHFYSENVLTGQRQIIHYDVDANFDGQFDERDKDVKFNLRYAVLTSDVAFSCGNLFPSLMKDAGIPTFGERSGGGACAIQQFCTAEGLQYQLSSARARLTDNQWANIDSGIAPTIPIAMGASRTVITDYGQSLTLPDYSEFWKIGTLIDNYYNSK